WYAQARQPRAIKLHELTDDAFLTQYFRDRQDQVRRCRPFPQLAMQPEADYFRNQHGRWLAEHRRFCFDTADAPAKHAKRVHHRGVGIGTDHRIGIGFDLVAAGHGANHARQIFQIDLMTDTRVRWHNLEILERRLAPAQEGVAFDIALKLKLRI